MAEDVAVVHDETSNACCNGLKKKHLKLLEKYSKLHRVALEELKLQVDIWKDEKEIESGRRVYLEDEVSALKEVIQSLKQSHNSAPLDAAKDTQERFNSAEKEIKELKEILEKERERVSLEKKKVELEKKKADEALKKVEAEKKKVNEAQNVAAGERKKAEENELLLENLKLEIDAVKSTLASENSKIEAAKKKAEVEKQRAARERKRADLAEIKLEEQRELAETNSKKAIFEKDRADDLNKKLEEASFRVEKLEELNEKLCFENAVKVQADKSRTGIDANKSSDVSMDLLKKDAQLPKWIEKLLLDKEHSINRERKRADSEGKKAKKHKKVAESQKKLALEQKHRADQLSKKLDSCRLMLKELQTDLEEFVLQRINAGHARLRTDKDISETYTVKLLKKRLRLEKTLVKHAN
ncbi:maternal effect embryo arrest 22 [Striga hermonthica]|uniref:Maternal effect embryo arrest 22 n=1 Tax=Striga hermonthica TaxID=68872 RepID=A0A9N7RLE0_STRHE|nr:maternal effect embryo arrest 22 [Striga hermonthica]